MMIKGRLLSSAPILLSIFGLGPNLTVLGDKYGFKIKFKFYNPQKAHPCVILRLLSYRA